MASFWAASEQIRAIWVALDRVLDGQIGQGSGRL